MAGGISLCDYLGETVSMSGRGKRRCEGSRSEVLLLLRAQPGGQWDKRWAVIRELGKGAGAGTRGVLPSARSVMGGFGHETGLISFMF